MGAPSIHPARIRKLNLPEVKKGPILYWMSRDMRSQDNWALLHAQQIALERQQPLIVIYNIVSGYLGGGLRQFKLKLQALEELEKSFLEYGISLIVTTEPVETYLPAFVHKQGIGAVVCDFDPLRIQRQWRTQLAESLPVAFYEVDAHNIVPCWVASPKRGFGAYTIRPKIHRLLPEFLHEFPKLQKHPFSWDRSGYENDWKRIENNVGTDSSVTSVSWLKPGEKAALQSLREFMEHRLSDYPFLRNDPTKRAVSDLSPYLHYGQLSAQRVALEIERLPVSESIKEAFLEELIVRRELSDNFCLYTPSYDSFAGFPDWAKKTLDEHRLDQRSYLYSQDEFETSQTHDELWNAAQSEMVKQGKMHGYMRMYWAKKILEWTKSPEEALHIAIYLNDKYQLDGRDPNGYTGIAWSIGGVHDRAWGERPVFGKIRYMSYNGCKGKFDVKEYIRQVEIL